MAFATIVLFDVIWLLILGFFIIAALDALRIRGAILIGIIAVTGLSMLLGFNTFQGVFSVSNITDEPNISYFGAEYNTGTIQYYGRQYYLGINAKF